MLVLGYWVGGPLGRGVSQAVSQPPWARQRGWKNQGGGLLGTFESPDCRNMESAALPGEGWLLACCPVGPPCSHACAPARGALSWTAGGWAFQWCVLSLGAALLQGMCGVAILELSGALPRQGPVLRLAVWGSSLAVCLCAGGLLEASRHFSPTSCLGIAKACRWYCLVVLVTQACV